MHKSGFVRVLENLENPGILFWHFSSLFQALGQWGRSKKQPLDERGLSRARFFDRPH